MSKAATKWARSLDLPFTDKAVLVEIAEAHSPKWGVCKPVQSAIARNLGLTRETVNRTIKRLEARGLITKIEMPRVKGQWDRRAYLLNPPEKTGYRVTEDHTAPCDFDQTRHRVTEDHTSKSNKRPSGSNVFQFSQGRKFGGGHA